MSWLEETGKPAAKKVAEVFGGTPTVRRHADEPEQNFIDTLRCDDRPDPGVVCYSTLGLHKYPNEIDDVDIRVELCGLAKMDVPDFADVVATCVFCKIKDGWRCAPGIAYPDVIQMYRLSTTMRHVVFVEPFLWEELSEVHLPHDTVVHWLMVLPISESEYAY